MVLRVLDFWGEKPSIHFTSLTCFCSLLLRHSRDVAPPVWATRGGGTLAHVPFPLWRVRSATPRRHAPSLRLLGSANCANAPALLHTTPVRRTRPPSSEPLLSLSTPINSLDIMRFATLSSHGRDKTMPPHRKIRTLTLTTGLACHHWDWDLGLGFGDSWCEDWRWHFLGLGLGFGIW